MDNEAEAKIDAVSNAVQGLATLLDKNGALNTSWILITEWMDSEGNFWFSTHMEPQQPVWRVSGMLDHAKNRLEAEHFLESMEGNQNDDGDNF